MEKFKEFDRIKPDSIPMKCTLREKATLLFTILAMKKLRHQAIKQLLKVAGHVTDEQIIPHGPPTSQADRQSSPFPPIKIAYT